MSKKSAKYGLIFPLMAILFACGDNSNDGSSNLSSSNSVVAGIPTTGTLTLASQPIAGMSYSSTSFSGITNAQGEFNYAVGEQVDFSIAGLEFGANTATTANKNLEISAFESEVLPSKYADFERYRQQTVLLSKGISGINVNFPSYANPQALDRLSNRLFLLYSLDADNDASNGIDLSAANNSSVAKSVLIDAALPINFNTFEYVARIKSRATLLTYNEGFSGFSALAKYLTALSINIPYPEAMCTGSSNSVPSSWSVNYKNSQQQSIIIDRFSSCPSAPDYSDAASYASNYSTDGKLANLYQYDDQNRLIDEFRDTDGTKGNFNRWYNRAYSLDGDKTVEAISYYYDSSGTAVLHDITTNTYLSSGLIDRSYVDDAQDDLTVYAYNKDNSINTETLYSEYEGQCWGGDINVVTNTDYYHYYDNGLLKQRSDEGMCAINTYDYTYNELGQTLSRKHNVDAKTDTDPNTISYEYERSALYNSAGNITDYTSLARNYDGSFTNSQYDNVYGYDDAQRLINYSRTSTNHNDKSISSSSSSYSYNGTGQIEFYCSNTGCSNKIEYSYTENGLIDTISSYGSSALIMKTYYIYNEDSLVVYANTFDAASLNAGLAPLDPLSPDYQTSLEYLPSGAVSLIDKNGYKQFYRDPAGDNASDSNSYYQWFDLDLGEHLNRALVTPRSFKDGGET